MRLRLRRSRRPAGVIDAACLAEVASLAASKLTSRVPGAGDDSPVALLAYGSGTAAIFWKPVLL
jgi:hypothetical protein